MIGIQFKKYSWTVFQFCRVDCDLPAGFRPLHGKFLNAFSGRGEGVKTESRNGAFEIQSQCSGFQQNRRGSGIPEKCFIPGKFHVRIDCPRRMDKDKATAFRQRFPVDGNKSGAAVGGSFLYLKNSGDRVRCIGRTEEHLRFRGRDPQGFFTGIQKQFACIAPVNAFFEISAFL